MAALIRHGVHIVDGGLLLPAWVAFVLEQRLSIDGLRHWAYTHDLELYEVLADLRVVALAGKAELMAMADREISGTRLGNFRNSSDNSGVLKVDQAADQLQMTARAVRKAAMAGRLAGVKSGARGDWQFTPAAVTAFAESRAR